MLGTLAQAAYAVVLLASSLLVLLDLRLRTSPLVCEQIEVNVDMDYYNAACSGNGAAFSFNDTAFRLIR